MQNIDLIDDFYKRTIKTEELLVIPDGLHFVNLEFLHHFDLLHFLPSGEHRDLLMGGYFQVIESQEKITLINQEFIVWIIPARTGPTSFTYALIALNREDQDPQLEAALIFSGIYNTSKLVIKVLEKFLMEIQETEKTLSNFQKTAS